MMEEVSEKSSREADYEKLFTKLESSKEGLSSQAAKQRIEKYGYNKIEEKKKSLVVQILGYFMGPIPWMIEIAAILSLIVRHWSDFFIILSEGREKTQSFRAEMNRASK